MQKTADRGHDPASRLAALELAQGYGHELVTGVLYRDPEPPPTYGALVKERQDAVRVDPGQRAHVLEAFMARQAPEATA